MTREKHIRRLIEITMDEFVAQTYSLSLGSQNAQLVSIHKHDGVAFKYKIPERICRYQEVPHQGKKALFPMSSALAVMDELSTYSFMARDKTGRTGVSVHLSTEYLKPIFAGEEITVTAKSQKTGKTLGFCDMSIYNSKDELVARGKHIKYLPFGIVWDIIASETMLPRTIRFYESKFKHMKNTVIGKKMVESLLGGRNHGHKPLFEGEGTVEDVFKSMDIGLRDSKSPTSIEDKVYHTFRSKPGMNNIIGRLHGGAVAMSIDDSVTKSLKHWGNVNNHNMVANDHHHQHESQTFSDKIFMQSMEVRYISAVKGELSVEAEIDKFDLSRAMRVHSHGRHDPMSQFRVKGDVVNVATNSHKESICAQYQCQYDNIERYL